VWKRLDNLRMTAGQLWAYQQADGAAAPRGGRMGITMGELRDQISLSKQAVAAGLHKFTGPTVPTIIF
jgi:hypothetical protein